MAHVSSPIQPLDGVVVVSLEQAVAGPLASRQLADLGARVIKIERNDGGDFARGYDRAVKGTSAHFTWLNRGKESLAVDLKAAAGRDAVERLVAGADVFLQNLAPGAAERLGFSREVLRVRHPSMIVVNLSGYGVGGPMEHHKAFDMLVQAEAGLITITGTPETPVKTGVPTADIASGMYCAQGALAALVRRARTGEGATIDVSMLDSTIEWMGQALYTQMYAGRQLPRMGLSHTSIVPYDAFPTRDGQVLIGVQNDSGWRSLVIDVLGLPELADDPRFLKNIDRVNHRAECDRMIAGQTTRWSSAELAERLFEAGVPAAQINDVEAVVGHPQLQARNRWRTVATQHTAARALLPPVTFTDTEACMGDVPALGQHTVALLTEAGLSQTQVADLLGSGVAHQAPSNG